MRDSSIRIHINAFLERWGHALFVSKLFFIRSLSKNLESRGLGAQILCPYCKMCQVFQEILLFEEIASILVVGMNSTYS